MGFTNQLKEVSGRLEHEEMKRSAQAQASEKHVSSSASVPCTFVGRQLWKALGTAGLTPEPQGSAQTM